MSHSSIVWRLLRRNISAGQIIGFALANLVGLVIVLTALQFYRDVTAVISSDDHLLTSDYIIISQRVEPGTFKTDGFSKSDIDSIAIQPWAKRIGEFTPSRFHVNGRLNMGRSSMSTYMFFEAIPDEFFDTKPDGWEFDSTAVDPMVPIVLSRDYLTLYNFGFAAARGLPQISEELISIVPLQVSISGKGRERTFPARVVGFSNRLNTIAAPIDFVRWANNNYAVEPTQNPMRLIIEVTDPANPAIKQYLETHDYESAGDKLGSGKAAHFFAIATSVVVGVGALICLLSLFILTLSIYLLIQKNRRKIHDLILLGYTPGQVSKYYIRLTAVTNVAVFILSCVVVTVAQSLWQNPIQSLGAQATSTIPTLLVGFAMVAVIILLNTIAIIRLTRRSAQS